VPTNNVGTLSHARIIPHAQKAELATQQFAASATATACTSVQGAQEKRVGALRMCPLQSPLKPEHIRVRSRVLAAA